MYTPDEGAPWTPDRLLPWSPASDGDDSEPDEFEDEEVHPEDSPFPVIEGSEADRLTARTRACGRCGQPYELGAPGPRPAVCWSCGETTFTAVGWSAAGEHHEASAAVSVGE